MFEHFHGADDVEGSVLGHEVFGRSVKVGERLTAECVRTGEERIARSVSGSNTNVGATGVHSGRTCTKTRERLRKKSTTTTDIGNIKTSKELRLA